MTNRCEWVTDDQVYIDYHDYVWGKPEHDNQTLFKFFCLEGQQAGLSWITILKRKENYEKAFDNFDPYKVAQYNEEKVDELMQDESIIRNRRKIESIIKNAKAYINLEEEGISFDEYVWSFTAGKVINNDVEVDSDIPTQTALSEEATKAFKKRGFSFIGPVSCYAFFQAIGVVNDHLNICDFK